MDSDVMVTQRGVSVFSQITTTLLLTDSIMAAIQSFRDLRVYRRALREAKRIFQRSLSFPKEERYSLTDQIRRSSRAVSAMVAEAWARRRYQAAFVNKINVALGEAMETQVWLDHARMCGYLEDAKYRALDKAWQQIGGMLQRMIQRADTFCSSSAE